MNRVARQKHSRRHTHLTKRSAHRLKIESLEDRLVMDYASAVLADNPVAYWRFNEASGTTAVNSGTLGNAANGVYQAGTTLGQASVFPSFGNAVDFNGSSGYVTTVAPALVGLGGSFTATAWVRLDATNGDRDIFGTDSGGTNVGLHLLATRNNNPHVGFYANDQTSTNQINTGEWYHIAFRYNVTTGEQAIFVNGQLDTSGIGHANFNAGGASTLLLGRWGGGNYIDGLMDEVAIFNTALSQAKIQAEYDAAFGTATTNDTASTTESAPVAVSPAALTSNDNQTPVAIIGVSNAATGQVTSTSANGVVTGITYNPNGQFESLAQGGPNGSDSFTYSVYGFTQFRQDPVFLGQFGAGGTYHGYFYNQFATTWDQARANARNTTFAGNAGYLVSLTSAAENTFARSRIAPDGSDLWIGLTDSNSTSQLDGVTLTGTEAGNNPNGGWVWVSGEAFSYQTFVGGEPNDSGGAEDAAQLRNDGLWNDHQDGATLGNQGNQQYRSIYEYNLGVTNLNQLVTPGFLTRTTQSSSGVGDVGTATLVANGSNVTYTVDSVVGAFNMNNNNNGDATGFYLYDSIVPGINNGADNFVIDANGYIYIPAAGSYTFGVNSDDGFSLSITGGNLVSVAGQNDNTSTMGANGVLRFSTGRGAGTPTLGTYSFTAPGFYQTRMINWDGGGGASLELFSAAGTQTAFDANLFRLVGDTQSGGLGVVTNLPTVANATGTGTVNVSLTGQNDTPTAVIAGTPSVAEGGSVLLSSAGTSDVDSGDILTYQWDLNGNGIYGEGVTANGNENLQNPTFIAAGNVNGPGSYTVGLKVLDNHGGTSPIVTKSITVTNTPPDVSISGPDVGVPGQVLSFQFDADDPSDADDAAGFNWTWNFGDPGNTADNVSNVHRTGSETVTHAFSNFGTFTITATAKDQNNGTSLVQTFVVDISPVQQDAGTGNVTFGGSISGGDKIVISPLPEGGIQIQHQVGTGVTTRYRLFDFFEDSRIIVYGNGGADDIRVQGNIVYAVELHGGAGNDYLAGGPLNDWLYGDEGVDKLLGGVGDDLEEGGNGNDSMDGGVGNDLLYGGAGADTMTGGVGNDVMFGGNGADKTVNGGAGDDLLFADGPNDLLGTVEEDGLASAQSLIGGDGNDVLVGGIGSDSLTGGNGNDILIGGLGLDNLNGGANEDILVSGYTDYDDAAMEDDGNGGFMADSNMQALLSLIDEWGNGGGDFATRVDNMKNGGGLTNGNVLDTTTTHNDAVRDTLTGSTSNDWFLAQLTDKTDRVAGEKQN